MMPENNNQPLNEKEAVTGSENQSTIFSSSGFPTTKPRRRSALKRQRRVLVIVLAAAILLGAAYIPVKFLTDRQPVEFSDGTRVVDADGTKYYVKRVNGTYAMFSKDGGICARTEDGLFKTKDQILVSVDATTGTPTVVAVPMTSGSEYLYFNGVDDTYDILLYPMIERSEIKSIEVKNEKDHFTFIRNKDDSFIISGHGKTATHVETPYDSTMFATLVSLTGYTNTVARLDLSPSNPDAEEFHRDGYKVFGLPENTEDAERYFIITTTDGVQHKVIIGTFILDDTGYYARYEGRDDVYVLQQLEESQYNSTLSGTLLCSLEDYVTPTVHFPMSSNNYHDVENFTLASLSVTPGATQEELLSSTKIIANFDFVPVQKRKDTFYANIPYFNRDENKGDYVIDDYQADICLQYLMDLLPLRTVKLFRDHTDTNANWKSFVEEYGLAYYLGFTFNAQRMGAEGDYQPIRKEQLINEIWISPQTVNENGEKVYYMYSEAFDMIVEVADKQADFLTWDDYKWINTTVFNGNIGYLDKMEIKVKNGTTAGLLGVEHVLFDIDYVDEDGNPAKGTDNSSIIQVFASYNGIQNEVVQDTIRFRYLYQTLLASNMEGLMPAGSEADQEALKQGEPDLEITLTFETGEETLVRTYRFYSKTAASGRGAYMTLNGKGSFYILQSRVDKIINDIGRALSKNEADTIDPEAKN